MNKTKTEMTDEMRLRTIGDCWDQFTVDEKQMMVKGLSKREDASMATLPFVLLRVVFMIFLRHGVDEPVLMSKVGKMCGLYRDD